MDQSMMRRPLVWVFLGFCAGIFLQYYCESIWITLLSALLLGGFSVSGNRYNSMLLPAVLLLLFSFCLGSMVMSLEVGRESGLLKQVGQSITLSGEAESVQDKGDYGKVLIQALWMETTEGEKIPLKEKVLVTLSGEPEELGIASFSELIGKGLTIKGVAELPAGLKNPGGFDYSLYLRTRDVLMLMKAETGQAATSDRAISPVLHGLAAAQSHFAKRLTASCGREVSSLMLSMLFGDKSCLEEGVYEDFQKNGVAHLLAVSGIHVNIVCLYVGNLLGKRRDLLPSLAMLLFLFAYAALSGFSPSVMRAVLMIAVSMGAILFRRGYDMYTGIAASAVVLLADQPFRIFDLGFQLSYLAVLSLAVILPWMNLKANQLADGLKKQWFLWTVNKITPMLAVQGMMIPITAYCFHYFSWSSFLLNPILIPLSGLIVPIGIVLFPLSFLSGAVGNFIFQFGVNGAEIPTRLMLFSIKLFSGTESGWFSVVSPPMGLLILFYLLAFFFCSESRYILLRRGCGKTAMCFAILILLFASFFPYGVGSAAMPHPFSRQTYPLVFVDVGQGDCLHIRTPSGKNVLIDGGGSATYDVGKKVLAPYLLKSGVSRIDLALVTHLHQDHYGGIVSLGRELPIEKLGVFQANRLREREIKEDFSGKEGRGRGRSEPQLMYLKQGDRIWLEKDIYIDVLAPEEGTEKQYEEALADEKDENALSLVLMVRYKGLNIMMTGDMGFPGEEALREQYAERRQGGKKEKLQAHMLKVGHHGSKYSTSEDFLNAIGPKAAVIQVGKNNFGHPSGKVIELFEKYGIIIYRTDFQGAMLVTDIASKEAAFTDVRKEKTWHIKL